MRDQVYLYRSEGVSNIMEAPKKEWNCLFCLYLCFRLWFLFSSSGGCLHSLVYDHIYLNSTSVFQFHSPQACLSVFLNMWVPMPLESMTLSKGSPETIRNNWYLHFGHYSSKTTVTKLTCLLFQSSQKATLTLWQPDK